MRVLAMERSTLRFLAVSNDTRTVLAESRAKIFREERMSLVVSNGSLVVSNESLAISIRTLAIALRTLAVTVRTLAVSVGTLAMAERVELGVTNKTLSMDSWALAISRVL